MVEGQQAGIGEREGTKKSGGRDGVDTDAHSRHICMFSDSLVRSRSPPFSAVELKEFSLVYPTSILSSLVPLPSSDAITQNVEQTQIRTDTGLKEVPTT